MQSQNFCLPTPIAMTLVAIKYCAQVSIRLIPQQNIPDLSLSFKGTLSCMCDKSSFMNFPSALLLLPLSSPCCQLPYHHSFDKCFPLLAISAIRLNLASSSNLRQAFLLNS